MAQQQGVFPSNMNNMSGMQQGGYPTNNIEPVPHQSQLPQCQSLHTQSQPLQCQPPQCSYTAPMHAKNRRPLHRTHRKHLENMATAGGLVSVRLGQIEGCCDRSPREFGSLPSHLALLNVYAALSNRLYVPSVSVYSTVP